jgi:type IV pilus assembly protein PilW
MTIAVKSSRRKKVGGGFTLTEVLVALVVGLIVTLAMFETLALFEGQKRTTVGSSEAQENGLFSLAFLGQSIRNAGVGLADPSIYDCTRLYTSLNGTSPIAGFALAPITVTDGGSSGSDTITIRYATNFLSSLPAYLTTNMVDPTDPLTVSRTFGFAANELVLAVQGSNCTLMGITSIDTANSQLLHANATAPTYNPDSSGASTWPAYQNQAKVFDLGQYVTQTYSINSNSLQVVQQTWGPTGLVSTTSSSVPNIVNLQAQYGIAAANSTNVTQWVDATGTWAPPSSSDQKRILAIRLVVVARNGQLEKTAVSSPCTTNSGVVNNGPCAWKADSSTSPAPLIDLSGDANWTLYRYKAYQTIIPLRNVLWTFS